ncbi:small nuclear ribonucleoprotein E [Thecamonas trahens ATCC 50062]|uniref:Small nuclear ribonucleoprotein E n=1 Tax=Thecamonas trahens ATCC 50062 TaxID=461836 RepID=A0A0L0D532_THETB|nr:small nuclear ribonucleoprotein E [Thecamonas trahens ATCC 50062]KNC47444.1 small nuclear ribonucleoprotein E [Thecamonas trahens ATCC 50062]|eukprot:XP_013759381.1 small nuclear ribonucleoprotein E [Thecamonas trahens ATCC 50062]
MSETGEAMTQPINLIFRFLVQKMRVLVWLRDNTKLQIEGVIIGYDEFMNLTLTDAAEITLQKGKRIGEPVDIGRILLKGNNIALIQPAPVPVDDGAPAAMTEA